MATEIVTLPIKDGDVPYFLYVYQRVTLLHPIFLGVNPFESFPFDG